MKARLLGGLLLLALWAGCSLLRASPAAPAPAEVAPEAAPERLPDAVVEQLSLIALGTAPSPALREEARALTPEQWVDRLLAEPAFARRIARPFIEPLTGGTPPMYTLRKEVVDGAEVHYLRKPCSRAEAERVSPWWDRTTEVLVCKDSHQPTHLVEPKSKRRCGSFAISPYRYDFCGCGPNLILCARDRQMFEAVVESAEDELVATFATFVQQDRHVSEAFTSRETVRNRYTEAIYTAARVLTGELSEVPDLGGWPVDSARLAARHEAVPGQHAGLLTTHQALRSADTTRARLKNYYHALWCSPPVSSGVDAHSVLALGVTDLRLGDGWKKLAAMPNCTSCHARLDYGSQFFAAFGNVYTGLGFDHAQLQEGEGELFGDDIQDPRGSAPLTPAGFAAHAVAQPEFAECMARTVTRVVLDTRATVDDQRAVLEAFRSRGTVKAMAREALLRRARWTSLREEATAAQADAATSRARLQTLFADSCESCHSEGPLSFAEGVPDRESLQRMLVEVASGNMPRSFALMDVYERREMVTLLAEQLWPDPVDRAQVLAPYSHLWSAPSYPPDVVAGILRARSGVQAPPASTPAILELSSDGQLGASALVGVTFEAVRLCEQVRETEARRACLERALEPEPLLNRVR